MRRAHLLPLCSLLVLAQGVTASHAQELLLYTPRPAVVEQAPAAPDQGVLVKTVTVKRGDTLAKLSRKHIGTASFFPQILVFNRIKNPDLIHTGDKLLVPLPAGRAVSRKKSGKTNKAAKAEAAPFPVIRQATSGEQESFQRAQRAYLDRDYPKAVVQLSQFLKKYPQSRFAADASLYRADSFLRMSGE